MGCTAARLSTLGVLLALWHRWQLKEEEPFPVFVLTVLRRKTILLYFKNWNVLLLHSSSWVPQGNYLESNRDECTVSLIYAVHLKKQGSVSFEYQYPDNNLLFEFFVSGTHLLAFHFLRFILF